MAGKIYISYRREDRVVGNRIRDDLISAFESGAVLSEFDVPPGETFASWIEQAIGQSVVLLAVIGPKWLEQLASDQASGQLDFVRMETTEALRRGKLVIPVLLDGARLPHPEEMPDDIRELATRHAHTVRSDNFANDVHALERIIHEHRGPYSEPREFADRAASTDYFEPSARRRAVAPSGAVASVTVPERVAPIRPADQEAKKLPVDASVFCPLSFRAGESELVQVLVHLRGQRRQALKMARAADPASRFTGASKNIGELNDGDVVAVSLDVNGATVEDPPEEQVWRGETLTFGFRISSDGQARAVGISAVLRVNGAHVGRISFKRRVRFRYSWSDFLAALFPPRLSRFKRVFFSYARVDRDQVLAAAREYEKFGISYFQDILTLDPGERWKPRLWKEIDQCDIFVLFWSSAAKASEFVIKEADRAWRRQARNGGLQPILRPEILERPVPLPDQDWLRAFHFDDPRHYRT
jgi:hypothetical protein